MTPIFQDHVFRACAMAVSLSLLQAVMTQSPYHGRYRNMVYPGLRTNYAPTYWGTINSLNNFGPYYMEPYFPQRPTMPLFSGGFGSPFGARSSFRRARPLFRNSIVRPRVNNIHGMPRMLTPVPPPQQQRHQMQKVRHHQEKKVRHHQEKKRVQAINAGIFPAVYRHPKLQRHIDHKAKKRAKFRGIPKAKSFNGILKGTALDVSF